MRNTIEATIILLAETFFKSEKTYLMPSYQKIQELLQDRHNKTIQRSRTFEILQIIAAQGLILRMKRYAPRGNGLSTQLSGILFLTLRFCNYLRDAGFHGWKTLKDRVLLYYKNHDNRYPQAPPIDKTNTTKTSQTENTEPPEKIPEKLKNIAGNLFKTIKQGIKLCL